MDRDTTLGQPGEWLRDSQGIAASPERWVELAEQRGEEVLALSRRARELREALEAISLTADTIKSSEAAVGRMRNIADGALKPPSASPKPTDLFTERLIRQGAEMMREVGRRGPSDGSQATPVELTDGTPGWVHWGEPTEIDLK
jgi:hypothetical protein